VARGVEYVEQAHGGLSAADVLEFGGVRGTVAALSPRSSTPYASFGVFSVVSPSCSSRTMVLQR
jgi:hypothetical protein